MNANKAIILCLIIICTFFSGCTEDGNTTNENKLNIISYDAFGITQEMLDQFTNETGLVYRLPELGIQVA